MVTQAPVLKRTRIDVDNVELFRGESYLVDTLSLNPYQLYASTLRKLRETDKDAKGICISTAHPNQLKSNYGIEGSYWLSSVLAEGNIPPTSPGSVLARLATLADDGVDLAFLDGVEFMSEFNDPHSLYQVVSEVREIAADHDKIFFVPIVEEALQPRYGALYRRILKSLSSPRARKLDPGQMQ